MPPRSASSLTRARKWLAGKIGGRNAFEGARVNRLSADWLSAWIQSPTQDVKFDLRLTRARARDMERNNPHFRRFLRLLDKNVIGHTGIGIEPKNRMLRGDTLHDEGNAELVRGWSDWGRKATCTVDGRLSWNAASRLVLRTVARDGECFIRKWPYFDNPHAFAIQILDADLFDEHYDVRALPNGNMIRMSIEMNPFGKPVAYWMWNQHPQDSGWGGLPLERIRVPAEQIEHLFIPLRAGQPRGITWGAPIMKSLKMGAGLSEAELVASRTAAAKMGFIVTKGDDQGPDPEESDSAERLMDASPGSIEELDPGQEFQSWDPQHPSANFGPFLSAIYREIAMGLDVAAVSLTGNLNEANFGSMRIGVIDERDTWRGLQGWFAEDFNEPIFREWLPCAQLANAVTLPGAPERWFSVNWRPRGWTWLDPLKDIQGAVLAVDNGLDSRTRILLEDGLDFDDVCEDLESEAKAAKKAGIVFTGLAKPPGTIAEEDKPGAVDAAEENKSSPAQLRLERSVNA